MERDLPIRHGAAVSWAAESLTFVLKVAKNNGNSKDYEVSMNR